MIRTSVSFVRLKSDKANYLREKMKDTQRMKRLRGIQAKLDAAVQEIHDYVEEERRLHAAVNRGSIKTRDRVAIVRLQQADMLTAAANQVRKIRVYV